MVNFGKRTEFRLKVKEQKVFGDRKQMQGRDLELIVGMGKGAKFSVLTATGLNEVLAVLPLVVVDVVDLLDKVVGIFTV